MIPTKNFSPEQKLLHEGRIYSFSRYYGPNHLVVIDETGAEKVLTSIKSKQIIDSEEFESHMELVRYWNNQELKDLGIYDLDFYGLVHVSSTGGCYFNLNEAELPEGVILGLKNYFESFHPTQELFQTFWDQYSKLKIG